MWVKFLKTGEQDLDGFVGDDSDEVFYPALLSIYLRTPPYCVLRLPPTCWSPRSPTHLHLEAGRAPEAKRVPLVVKSLSLAHGSARSPIEPMRLAGGRFLNIHMYSMFHYQMGMTYPH